MTTRTVIRGGLVITATEELRADVLIEGERIAALATTGSEAALAWTADNHIDAAGHYVIPGGVDAHTHMELPFGGTHASDTFETGTRAAAWGGTTTIVDFAVQPVGGSLREGLDAWHAKADGNCAVDYAFHTIVSDVNDAVLKEMDALVDSGESTSFKLFMAYPGVFYSDDGRILRAMQRGAANGGLIMMHAENGIAIDVLVEQALAAGRTSPATTARSAANSSKPRPPTAPSNSPRSPAAPSTSSTSPPPPPSPNSPAPATTATPSSARPAPSTSSSPPTTSRRRAPTASKAPSTCAAPRCAPASTRRRSGAACAPTTSRWCPPTTARSATRDRRNSAGATSRRSPTACPAWRTGWTCSTRRWSTAT